MTRPEHAAHDPDRSIPIQYRGGGAPLRSLLFSTEIRYRSALFGYNPVQSGTIGYRLVEIGYSLPDLYRDASSVRTRERRAPSPIYARARAFTRSVLPTYSPSALSRRLERLEGVSRRLRAMVNALSSVRLRSFQLNSFTRRETFA